MSNNKTENTRKQGKREKTAATPNKGKTKLLRLLEIMKLGHHSHHKNQLATLMKCWKN